MDQIFMLSSGEIAAIVIAALMVAALVSLPFIVIGLRAHLHELVLESRRTNDLLRSLMEDVQETPSQEPAGQVNTDRFESISYHEVRP